MLLPVSSYVIYDYGVEQAATLPFVLPPSTRALVWPTLLYILLNLYRLPSTILYQVAGTRYETYTSSKVAGILERKGRQHSRLKSRCARKPGLDIRTAMPLGHTSEYAPRPGSSASLRDSPNLNPGSITNPSNSTSGSSYYMAHSEMEQVRQLPGVVLPQPLVYIDVPLQQNNNEQATTVGAGGAGGGAAAIAIASVPTNLANPAGGASSATSASASAAGDINGTQSPPSQNHTLFLVRSRRFSPLRHFSSPPPSPSRSPTTTYRNPHNACGDDDDARWPERSSAHPSPFSFARVTSSIHSPRALSRPASARDTSMSYGQSTVKQQQKQQQQQQHNDRRSRRDSIGSDYPMMQMVSHLSSHVRLTRPHLILAPRTLHIQSTTR